MRAGRQLGTAARPSNALRGGGVNPVVTDIDSVLDEIVRRVVEVAQPERIILFGSAARGYPDPARDLDLLVVKTCANRRELAARIRRKLYGVRAAVDIVVATPEDIERYKDSHPLVYKPALREGQVVYDSA